MLGMAISWMLQSWNGGILDAGASGNWMSKDAHRKSWYWRNLKNKEKNWFKCGITLRVPAGMPWQETTHKLPY